MSLDATVTARAGELSLCAAVRAGPGETVAVLGPNGAGKTTLLRVLAGLHRLGGGSVTLDGRLLDDPAARVHVAPEDRSVAIVFQDYLLFPHLDALENVAFGLRARGTRRAPARRRAEEWLGRLGLAEHARSRPRELSGGQAQRVALARALAWEPALVLLDEPLAALDVDARAATRRLLRRELRARAGPAVLVTHDPVDAASLADRVLVLEAGRVVQEGPLASVVSRPRSRFVAELAGLNLLPGWARGTAVLLTAGGTLRTPEARDGPVYAAIAPRAVALHREAPSGSPRNVWPAVVEHLEPSGDRVRVQLDGAPRLVAEVTTRSVQELGLAPGAPVIAAVKATEVDVYPR